MAELSPSERVPLTLLLADPGGREMGGLSLTFSHSGLSEPLQGRVGVPTFVPKGDVTVFIPTQPAQTLTLNITEEQTLDLGRLAALLIRVHRRGKPCFIGSVYGLLPETGGSVIGWVDRELALWPGAYELTVPLGVMGEEGVVEKMVTVEAGRLLELELGEGPGAKRVKDLLREFSGAGRTVLRRVLSRPLSEAKSNGFSDPIGLTVCDGLNNRLGCKVELSGLSEIRGTLHKMSPIPIGSYKVKIPIVGGEGTLWMPGPDKGLTVELAALDVHLKDPEGVSLRGAVFAVTPSGGGQKVEGEVGRLLDLWPGKWSLSFPKFPGFEREIDLEPGEITRADLGLAHHITVEPTVDHPFGTAFQVWREDTPLGTSPLRSAQVGEECLLPGGVFRLEFPDGTVQKIKAKRRRKRWPAVAGRILGADSARAEAAPSSSEGP